MSQVKVHAAVAAHAATFVATGMLRGVKQIVVGAGLSPRKLADDWTTLETGIATWLRSGHLQKLTLEVWDPARPADATLRFDFTIDYSYSADADGELWLDPRTVRQAILKAGKAPSACEYELKVDNSPGAAAVYGWGPCSYRSTSGMTEYRAGTAITGGALGAGLSYWVRN
jgi:hypothetical protein